MKKATLIFCLLLFFQYLFSQADTSIKNCGLRISLLTCTPGSELYSTFGHSALRVTDSLEGTDVIYNYGTFDFTDPDFYFKFVRGKLLYFVSVDEFPNFMAEYEYEKRGITEQELDLSCSEKEKMFAALQENAKEENKYYKYDFVYDNCTTRLRDIVQVNAASPFNTKPIIPQGTSFRHLIHEYLNKGGQYWSKVGIDMLLGIPLDKEISNSEAMFLPDYLLKGFDSTVFGQKILVAEKKIILGHNAEATGKMIFSPFVVFLLLFILITILSFSPRKKAKIALRIFDNVFFFFCGIIGALILFMWFGTEHTTARNNLNIAWALPTHLIVLPFMIRGSSWVKKYFTIVFWVTLLLLVSWFFLPQQMNNALLPVVGIILVRSFVRMKEVR